MCEFVLLPSCMGGMEMLYYLTSFFNHEMAV